MKLISYQYTKYILFLIVGLFLGWLFFSSSGGDSTKGNQTEKKEAEVWTCSMHPQIKMDKFGKCPLCGMDLIPLTTSGSGSGIDPDEIHFTKEAAMLSNVMTTIVSNDKTSKEVRLYGKVQADERLIQSQVSYVSGRIEKLYINFTGEAVKRGQLLALIYSPDLITAQQELLETLKTKHLYPEFYEAAKEKLVQWKLSTSQIATIESSKKIKTNMEVYATSSGIVTAKNVTVGDFISQGTVLYEVSDLSRIWVLFDAFESDLHFLKKGNKIDFTVEAIPNSKYSGTISFIDPVIDPINRVAKVRVEISNTEEKLKPEMFVTGSVKANLDQYQNKMVIPKTAVLWTGKRSVVYVKKPGDDYIFKLREIEIGPLLGNSYVVEKGIEEGEEIVTNGAFSVDAAAQLEGKKSMMNLDAGMSSDGHQHGSELLDIDVNQKITSTKEIKATLEPLIESYVNLQKELANDNFLAAKKQLKSIKNNLDKVDMNLFKNETHEVWMQFDEQIAKNISMMENTKNIENFRKSFLDLSETYVSLVNLFGPFNKKVFIINCPMANNNKGADWLSFEKEVRNPYYGKSMLTCGKIRKEY